MELNISYLKYFFDTIELGSMNFAAEKNFVSQPAISQGIKKLEADLGISLLIHQKKNLVPTQNALLLYEESKKLFLEKEKLTSYISNLRNEMIGKIKITSSYSISKRFLLPFIKSFKKKYPLVDIELNISKTVNQIQKLKSREIDLALILTSNDITDLPEIVLRKGLFNLYGKKRLINKEVYLTEARAENSLLLKRKIKHNEVQSWELIFDFIQNSLGIGLIPDFYQDSKINLKNYNKEFKYGPTPYCLKLLFLDEKVLSYASTIFKKELVGFYKLSN